MRERILRIDAERSIEMVDGGQSGVASVPRERRASLKITLVGGCVLRIPPVEPFTLGLAHSDAQGGRNPLGDAVAQPE